ncbi:MAG: hypothetical protein ACRCSL_04660 [Microbacterium sp.]
MIDRVHFVFLLMLAVLGVILEVVMNTIALAILVGIPFLIIGCPRQQCLVSDTRCTGSVVEYCSAGGEWHPLMDCAETASECRVGSGDVNGRPVEGHVCMPQGR